MQKQDDYFQLTTDHRRLTAETVHHSELLILLRAAMHVHAVWAGLCARPLCARPQRHNHPAVRLALNPGPGCASSRREIGRNDIHHCSLGRWLLSSISRGTS